MSTLANPSTEPAAAGLHPVDAPQSIMANNPEPSGLAPEPSTTVTPTPSNETLTMDKFADLLSSSSPTKDKPLPEVRTTASTIDKATPVIAKPHSAETTLPALDKPITEITAVSSKTPVGQDAVATNGARDYSIFEEGERDLLKKASNEVFAHLSKELPRLRAIEKSAKEAAVNGTRLPDSLAQHPNAYVLSPEFAQVSQELKYLSFEENHWTEQARRAEEGEKEIFDLAYDAQGNPKFTAIALTKDNISAIKVGLNKNINQTVGKKQQYEGAAQQIQTTYGTRWSAAAVTLKDAEKKYFGAYEAPDNPRSKEISEFKKLLPSEFQQHPLANTVAKLYAYVLDGSAAYKKLGDELSAMKQIQQDRIAAGPTSSAATGGGSNGISRAGQLSMSEFTSRLNGG